MGSFAVISMAYDVPKINMTALMRPAFDAGIALIHLDERIASSPVGQGFVERSHFTDACASLWIDGELVHLEDLVLHDDVRDTGLAFTVTAMTPSRDGDWSFDLCVNLSGETVFFEIRIDTAPLH